MDGVSGRPLNWLPSGLTALISSLERADSLAVQLKAFSVTQAVKALLSVKDKLEKDDSWGPASSGFNRSGSLDALRELTKPLVGGAGLYGMGFHLTSSVFPCESDEFCECQGCGCGDPDCAVCEPCVSEEEFEYEEHHVVPELQYQWGLGLGSVALNGGPNPYFRSQRLASKEWPNVHNFGWAKLLETRAAVEERECAQSVSGSSGKVGEGNVVAKDDDDARGSTGVCEKSPSMGSTFNDVRRDNVDAGEVPDSRGREEGLQSSKKADDSPQRSTEATEAVSESQRNHATTRADVKRSQGNVDNVANVASSTSLTSPNWWPFGAQSVVAPSIRETAKWNFRMGQNAVAGALAGGVVSLCLHPIDTLKTIVQSQTGGSRNLLPILSSVISERGLKGLYRGLGSNLASSAPTSAIYTLTYEAVKAGLLPHIPEDMSALAHCGAGACASVATSIVYTPSECVKQQMQVNGLYQNSWQTFTSLLKQGGLPMLYKGWGAVLCRNVPQSVIKFYTYEALKHWARGDQPRDTPMTTLQALAIGGVAGSTAAFFTTPFDVVKTRLQTQIPGSVQQYNGVIHAFQYIATTEGVAGLYRGLVPRLVIYVTQGALFFASYEFIKHVLAVEVPRLRIKASQIEGYQRQSAPIPAEST